MKYLQKIFLCLKKLGCITQMTQMTLQVVLPVILNWKNNTVLNIGKHLSRLKKKLLPVNRRKQLEINNNI